MQKNLITDPNITAAVPHKYLGFLGMIWVSILLLGMFTSLKTFQLYGLTFSVAVIAYPLTYIFSDIFTEVYGYKISRRTIWTGFFCIILVSYLSYVYSLVPASEFFKDSQAFDLIFKLSPFVAMISILSFSVGEFINSFTVAKLKLFTNGKLEGLRFILSTLFGQVFDNGIFFVSAWIFVGWYSSEEVLSLVVTTVVFCTVWEILAMPITKRVIRWIKEKEGIDTYDHGTNFNPFKL